MSVKEIKKIIGIDKIETIKDVLKINNFCFQLIPWVMDSYKIVPSDDLSNLFNRFKEKKIGGWCGLNAQIFSRLMWGVYDFDKSNCIPFNYGLGRFTHVTAIVTVDNTDYLMDPYFSRHYAYENGDPVNFKDLISFIQNRDMCGIKEIYGDGLKPVYQESQKEFLEWKPQKLLHSVTESWVLDFDLMVFMEEKFNCTDLKLLMLTKVV